MKNTKPEKKKRGIQPTQHDTDVSGASNIVRVVFINDLHTGHEVGLWPEDQMVLPHGEKRPLNSIQCALMQHWNEAVAEIRQDIKPDILIINGDLLDGEQRKQGGQEATAALVEAQRKAARKLLEPLASAVRETYVIRGTPYHDGPRGLDTEPVAEHLGAIGPNDDWKTWGLLDLRIRGSVVINVQHAVSISAGFYRATPLDREGIFSALAGKEHKIPRADAVARAHAHVFVHVEHPTKHIFINPCWQGQTDYMRRHSAYRMIPDIGFVVLDVDPREKARGRDPILLRKVLYDMPEVKAWDSKV